MFGTDLALKIGSLGTLGVHGVISDPPVRRVGRQTFLSWGLAARMLLSSGPLLATTGLRKFISAFLDEVKQWPVLSIHVGYSM